MRKPTLVWLLAALLFVPVAATHAADEPWSYEGKIPGTTVPTQNIDAQAFLNWMGDAENGSREVFLRLGIHLGSHGAGMGPDGLRVRADSPEVEALLCRLVETADTALPTQPLEVICKVVLTRNPEALLSSEPAVVELALPDGPRVPVPSAAIRPKGVSKLIGSAEGPTPTVNADPDPTALQEALTGTVAYEGSAVVIAGTPASAALPADSREGRPELPFSFTPYGGQNGRVTVEASLPWASRKGAADYTVAQCKVRFSAVVGQTVAIGLVYPIMNMGDQPTPVYLVAVRPG